MYSHALLVFTISSFISTLTLALPPPPTLLPSHIRWLLHSPTTLLESPRHRTHKMPRRLRLWREGTASSTVVCETRTTWGGVWLDAPELGKVTMVDVNG
ncbi:hypothetical protein B0J14DRAFT_611012 [Halenospora varia]|nr:hypothetical protein B0J14DRAFT_611012 [Halenospora varia]